MDRKKKEEVVAELHEKLQSFDMAVLTTYSGLNVERMTELRRNLRKTQAEIRVVKNNLLRIASEGTDLEVLKDRFEGPLALVLVKGDVVEPAKVLVDFARRNSELEFRMGVMGGKVMQKEDLFALATLPGREVLLGKLLGILVAVPTSLVNVLSAVPRSIVQVLDAYRRKKESEN